MSRSKDRLRWHEMPAQIREAVQNLAGDTVVQAVNCEGGYSPGLASRLTLAGGGRVFAKAVQSSRWAWEGDTLRAEAAVAGALPQTLAVPQMLGIHDDGDWVALLFEHIDGVTPAHPWTAADLDRVAAAAVSLHGVTGLDLPRDHPRLGGWEYVNPAAIMPHSPWAASSLEYLAELEQAGMLAGQGETLVHFDLYAHNVLLTPDHVVIVDWPHARLGAPFVDLVMLLSAAASSGLDPDPYLHRYSCASAPAVDALLAAHTGFLLGGAFSAAADGLEAISEAKLHLGLSALRWLESRLVRP